MKHMKKLIAAFLTLAVALVPCMTTVQAAPKIPKSQTVYMQPKGTGVYNILITGLSSSQDVTNIKSSNTKIIPNNMMVDTPRADSHEFYLWFEVKKAGNATISLKVKGKIYRIKVTAKKYVNPVRSLSITGVKSKGKNNLASLSNKETYISNLKMSKPKTAPTIKISAKKGWKVSKIMYTASGVDNAISKDYKKPVSNVTLKMRKKTNFIEITFINTKSKGTRIISYPINYPS